MMLYDMQWTCEICKTTSKDARYIILGMPNTLKRWSHALMHAHATECPKAPLDAIGWWMLSSYMQNDVWHTKTT